VTNLGEYLPASGGMVVKTQNTTEGVGLTDFTVTNTTLTFNGTSGVHCSFTNVEGPSFAALNPTASPSSPASSYTPSRPSAATAASTTFSTASPTTRTSPP
jgi:hypothetical protein